METNLSYYNELITKYFLAEATPEEILELEAWVKADPANASHFAGYSKTWRTVENERINAGINLDKEWNSFRSRISASPAVRIDPGTRVPGGPSRILHPASFMTSRVFRAAAVALILLIPAYFFFRSFSTTDTMELTAVNGILETTLPDGTAVTLNSGATLTCPKKFDGSFRHVSLKGEAWFEVAHDNAKPFIIAAGNARIRVVGTSFFVNTMNYGNKKEVILSSGVVRVYYQEKPGETTILFPGDKAEMETNGFAIIKSHNDDVNYLSWKTRHIVFGNTPLNEVAALLTRVYRTSIRLSDDRLSNCRITATFDKQSLESVLNVLKATLDLQVRNTGSGIVLSGQGCNQGQ